MAWTFLLSNISLSTIPSIQEALWHTWEEKDLQSVPQEWASGSHCVHRWTQQPLSHFPLFLSTGVIFFSPYPWLPLICVVDGLVMIENYKPVLFIMFVAHTGHFTGALCSRVMRSRLWDLLSCSVTFKYSSLCFTTSSLSCPLMYTPFLWLLGLKQMVKPAYICPRSTDWGKWGGKCDDGKS